MENSEENSPIFHDFQICAVFLSKNFFYYTLGRGVVESFSDKITGEMGEAHTQSIRSNSARHRRWCLIKGGKFLFTSSTTAQTHTFQATADKGQEVGSALLKIAKHKWTLGAKHEEANTVQSGEKKSVNIQNKCHFLKLNLFRTRAELFFREFFSLSSSHQCRALPFISLLLLFLHSIMEKRYMISHSAYSE